LDLVAGNTARGVTIVEFKVNAGLEALSQLLIYPHAFRKALDRASCTSPPPLRMVLVTPFLDFNVVEILQKIQPPTPIILRLCMEREGEVCLTSPPSQPLERHCWDQSERPGHESQVNWKDGGVCVRGKRLGEA